MSDADADHAQPLLLHSLAEFRSLILPILDAVGPQRIVELGGEGGQLTGLLADWADAHGATVACVDPAPSPNLRKLGRNGRVELIEGKSPGALTGVDPFDLYVVDGDHNHFVVSGELEAIFGDTARTPVALFHDVAWPAARRDQYYDPDDVPVEHRQAHDYVGGAVPGLSALQPRRGFRGAGSFAYALEEGGPRNGVLTAIEDLLATRDDLELRRVPVIFGFGAVYGTEAEHAPAIRTLLDPFHESELLATLEANRLALYLEVIDRREAAQALTRGQRAALAALERDLEAERAESAHLRLLMGETGQSR